MQPGPRRRGVGATTGRYVVIALAAVLTAVAVGLRRPASATTRLRQTTRPALAGIGWRLYGRLTFRASAARREREAVGLVRALAAELRAGAPEGAALAAVAASGGSL